MQLRLLSIGLSFSILGLAFNPLPGISQDFEEDKFFCKQSYDEQSGNRVPATVAWIPQRQVHVLVLIWKSEYFGKTWNPQRRCQVVSQNFQKVYRLGYLKFLTIGKNKSGLNTLCAVAKEGGICTNDSHLFTINPNNDPKKILKSIRQLFEGQGRGAVYQKPENLYIKVDFDLAKEVDNR